jgi:hypothetical protein
VTQTSYEYTGDFTLAGPMIGIDYSAASGFGYFLRGSLIFASDNYKKGSTTFGMDMGICWRFNLFSAP